jgi:hypothetical protein
MITIPSSLEGLREVYVKNSLNAGVVRRMEERIDRENEVCMGRFRNL